MADTEAPLEELSSEKPAKSRKLLTLAIAAGLVLGEGAAIFVITRMMYHQPDSASADELTPEEKALQAIEELTEITLPEVNAFNKREGRLFLYNFEVTVVVAKDRADEVQKILEARQSTILDRLNTVIRGSETKFLNEPGLDTLRRQFRFELDKILGDDELIVDLVIPRFYQSPADL